MTDPPAPRGRRHADPVVVALSLALREIADRRAAELAGRRAKMVIIDGRKQREGEAA